ncbi:MAG TPA: VanW family protein [Candidatus Sulfotelmatobacter sp.]|nr:VanW family protein [Candidatus Sulfotelmatobacter sp.]
MKINFKKLKFKVKFKFRKKILRTFKIIFWFFLGAFLSLFFIASFGLFGYQKLYENKIYPGVYVNNINFGGKTKQEVENYFEYKNSLVGNSSFVFTTNQDIATISAKEIGFGFDNKLSSDQAYDIGRSNSLLSNLNLILQAYLFGVYLPPSYSYNQNKLTEFLKPLSQNIEKKPVDAIFKFENNRVTTFRPSSQGKEIDYNELDKKMISNALAVTSSANINQIIIINIPIKIIEPKITTEKVNNLGIKELIGEGHSRFYHSIPSRVYNINLATSRINGVLVAPGETFSFDKALGDVSAFTGYQQAYVIQNGKTVLGDGGGVCQVSTTFFRALLNAGLPIVERNAHAYRVGYYEEDSPPGIDATIFVPTVDLKFKNDTGHYILVQSDIDLDNLSLGFYLYGTKDQRHVSMTAPIVSNETPPPPDLYQDDPTLPKGEIKQTDFSAWGANVYFTRTVTKNNKIIISDKFISNYRPWQAIYLRGTKE